MITAFGVPSLTVKLGALNWKTERGLKVAVTERSPSISTTQLPVPPQAPAQPANHELACGVAVRVTGDPGSYSALQVGAHASPPELAVTVPVPLPARVTVRRVRLRTRR